MPRPVTTSALLSPAEPADARLPTEFLGRGFDRSRVASAQMLQAEFDRVGFRGERQLVDEALAGEMDLRPDRIAQMRGAERRDAIERRRDRFPGQQPVRDVVGFIGRAERIESA